MSEGRITEQLRIRLDEVGLVYHQLPKTLDRALKATEGGDWRVFFQEQASVLRRQLLSLRAMAQDWGKRTRPFYSPEVEEQLNEALHAVRNRRAVPSMEEAVRNVLLVLRARVLVRLDEAIQLATTIREHELVGRLRTLHEEESQLQLAMEEARSRA